MPVTTKSPYMTTTEAAGYAHVSVRTIRRAISTGALRAGGTVGKILVRQEWVDEWLETRRNGGEPK